MVHQTHGTSDASYGMERPCKSNGKAGLQYTGDQCENKFASLKKQYLNKIDKMGAKSSVKNASISLL
jgi:hypothetical protein